LFTHIDLHGIAAAEFPKPWHHVKLVCHYISKDQLSCC